MRLGLSFLIVFLATLEIVTAGSGFWDYYDARSYYAGDDKHYHCGRMNQPCQNGQMCDYETGLCQCYNDWDGRWDEPLFLGYDCSINVTSETELIRSSSCPCQHVSYCYREDNVTLLCPCPSDYYGDDCSINRVTLDCQPHSMRVYFKAIEPFYGKAYIGDDPDDWRCILYEHGDPSLYAISMYYDDNNCNQTVYNMTNDIKTNTSYTYQLRIQYDPIIQDHLDLVIDVTCHHFENGTWSTESSFGVTWDEFNKGDEIKSEYFPVYTRFTIDGYTIRSNVYLGQRITMLNGLTDDEVYSRIFVESCTFSDSVEDKKVTLIEDGCLNERSVWLAFDGPFVEERPDYPYDVAYSFRVFRFGNDPVVRVTCRVRLCKRNEESMCELPDCNDRDRREAGDEFGRIRRKRQARGDQGVISKTFNVLDPYDKDEQGIGDINAFQFQVTADKCMSEPVIKSVGISLVVVITVLLVVSIVLALCVCRMMIARRERALKLRYRKDNPTTSFSNNGFEGGISDDSKSKGT